MLFFGNLILPKHLAAIQYISYALMAIAEVITGFWLLLFAVKTQARGDQPSA